MKKLLIHYKILLSPNESMGNEMSNVALGEIPMLHSVYVVCSCNTNLILKFVGRIPCVC